MPNRVITISTFVRLLEYIFIGLNHELGACKKR